MRNTSKRRTKGSINNRILLSFTLTLLILASLMLVNVQPASAVSLSLPSLPSSMCIGYTYTFYAQINIDGDELVPINDIRLDINGATPVSAVFQVDGTIVSSDAQIISIEFLGTSNYEYGYLCGTDATYGYDYSWGYGYGYGQMGSVTQLQYRISVSSTGMTAGAYTAQLTTTVIPGPEVFHSPVYNINVRVCSGGGYVPPTETPIPTPTVTPTPTPTPTVTPTPTPTPTVTPTPTSTPTGTPGATPTGTPGATPTGTPGATPTGTVSPTPTATSTPTAAPTVPSGGGTGGKSDMPDDWVLIIIAIMGGALLAGLFGAIIFRLRV